MLQITRATSYLFKKGVLTTHINIRTIFIEQSDAGFIPKLGLPEFTNLGSFYRKDKDLSQSFKKETIASLLAIFLFILLEREIPEEESSKEIEENIKDEDVKRLLLDMKESAVQLSLGEIMRRIFALNFEED